MSSYDPTPTNTNTALANDGKPTTFNIYHVTEHRLLRVFDVALLGHVDTVEELTDILVAHESGLVDESA